jgi:hypothetical protein
LAFVLTSIGIFTSSRLAPKAAARLGLSPLMITGTTLQAGALLLLA